MQSLKWFGPIIVGLLIAMLAVSIAILVFTIQLIESSTLLRSESTSEYIVVNTATGPVRGRKQFTLYDDKPFYSFRGIPYAKPPIGSLRFKVRKVYNL